MSVEFQIKRWIHVDAARQRVQVFDGESPIWESEVSTSRFGLGEKEGSFCTPRGWFLVAEKIGDGAPVGAIFQSRIPTGEIWIPGFPLGDQDLILTRILWLEGAEPHNQNTRQRYIYFHGTNQEELVGSPMSHGCIRLRNEAILKLYGLIPVGTAVRIV